MKYFKWLQEHWGFIAILSGGFWTVIVSLYMAFVAPVIDAHIDSRIDAWKKDSLSIAVDTHLKTKGGGFRGQLSDTTKIPKNLLVSKLGGMMIEESETLARIKKLEEAASYQEGYNFFVLKNIAEKSSYKSVTFWLPSDGNAYYLDVYKQLWDAKFDNYDDCYYYYPSYANGNRLKCD